jgi:hypothetical protein
MELIVASRTVVSIEYELCNEQGIVLESNKGFAALDYVQGTGTLLPAIEQALYGCTINLHLVCMTRHRSTSYQYRSTCIPAL